MAKSLQARARGCRCAVPCPTFKCISSHHQGSRATPWCRGCDDGEELKALVGSRYAHIVRNRLDLGWCDDCWVKRMRGYVRKRVRDFKRVRQHTMVRWVREGGVERPVRTIKEYAELIWLRGTWLPDRRKIG